MQPSKKIAQLPWRKKLVKLLYMALAEYGWGQIILEILSFFFTTLSSCLFAASLGESETWVGKPRKAAEGLSKSWGPHCGCNIGAFEICTTEFYAKQDGALSVMSVHCTYVSAVDTAWWCIPVNPFRTFPPIGGHRRTFPDHESAIKRL